MTDDEQEARSLKFEPRGTVNLRQLSSGLYAMYPLGGIGSPFWIGPGDEVLAAYASRPEPQPHARPSYTPKPKLISGINIDELEIDL